MSFSALRQHAAGLPGVTQDIKWEVDWVASVGGRMFLVGGPHPKTWAGCSFKVDDHRFLELTGVPGINSPSEVGGGGNGPGGNSDGGNMTDRVVNSAMKYRTQVAFVDGLMKDLGLPMQSLGSAGSMSFRNFAEPEALPTGAGDAPKPKSRKSSKDDD